MSVNWKRFDKPARGPRNITPVASEHAKPLLQFVWDAPDEDIFVSVTARDVFEARRLARKASGFDTKLCYILDKDAPRIVRSPEAFVVFVKSDQIFEHFGIQIVANKPIEEHIPQITETEKSYELS